MVELIKIDMSIFSKPVFWLYIATFIISICSCLLIAGFVYFTAERRKTLSIRCLILLFGLAGWVIVWKLSNIIVRMLL